GAAYLAGAEPYFLPCLEATGFNADYASVPADIWQRCQLLFVCSPGNPTGSTLSLAQYKELIALADQYNFIIASDECYSELWVDGKEAPAGLLQA
ncbi:aminotransferase class I/II-fold pyridoxal phosphate-dependent enzyme, partial [Wenyingzhuangia sp. 1_MG-2023]|nr:aminotransferase class I/II-fold pyridoxal phosphate-dependent enzyme [Wenyingzhuangia sp. 1_MG-2023]